jgi:ParB-like chromosome segregation protein Spo0J
MSEQSTIEEQIATQIVDDVRSVIGALDGLPLNVQVKALNDIKAELHKIGPFSREPVDCVLWIPVDNVTANDYNPNSVAPPEMRLLEHSIKQDGFTQPIVGFQEESPDDITVIDGFHRYKVGKMCKSINRRLHGYLPVTIVNQDRTNIKDRMAATIRHNRARGVHGVMPLTDIVQVLLVEGWGDTEIAKELGMDADEVLRFKQNCGLPDLFKDQEFSRAWE